MKKLKAATVVVFGSIVMVGMTGCERAEQAANDALERAKQSAARVLDETRQPGPADGATQTDNNAVQQVKQSAFQALDEIRQAGSIEEAAKSANRALRDARQMAGGWLGQASEYLANDQPEQASRPQPEADSPPAW